MEFYHHYYGIWWVTDQCGAGATARRLDSEYAEEYADDVLYVAQGSDMRIIGKLMQTELKIVQSRCKEINLTISADRNFNIHQKGVI